MSIARVVFSGLIAAGTSSIWFMLVGGSIQTATAETLDEALGVGVTEYQASSPETQQLWNRLLETMQQNPSAAANLLKQFSEVKDRVEPYQKTFCSLGLQVICTNSTEGAETIAPEIRTRIETTSAAIRIKIEEKTAEISKQIEDNTTEINKQIDADTAEINGLKQQIQTEEANKASLLNNPNISGTAGAIVGKFLPSVGSVANTVNQNRNASLAQSDRNIADHRRRIAELERTVASLRSNLATTTESLRNDLERVTTALRNDLDGTLAALRKKNDDLQSAFRQHILAFLNEMKMNGHLTPVLAMASLYQSARGEDALIVTIAQSTVDLQKQQAQAIRVTNAALKPAKDLIDNGRFWDARAEIEKASESIRMRVTDAQLLRMIQLEMKKTQSDVDGRIEKAMKQRNTAIELARRDYAEGSKQFDSFMKAYPDYPDVDQDALKFRDIKEHQVGSKFAKQIAAIEEVTQNDPQEAKVMIKKLLEADVSAEDISVLKSRVTALRRTILNRELAQIQDRMDEAQKFLEKVSVDYAMSIKKGTKPERSLIEKATMGTENLVRARSLQAGAIKQLEVLMQDPDLDLISKAKLTGLLESQKAAVAQIDNDLSSKSSVFMGLGVVVFVAILGVVAFLFIRKRGTFSQPKVVK